MSNIDLSTVLTREMVAELTRRSPECPKGHGRSLFLSQSWYRCAVCGTTVDFEKADPR